MTELMVLPSDKKGIEQVFIEGQDIDSTITNIREIAKDLPFDMSVRKNREEVASFAYKIARSKIAVDKAGAALSADYKEIPKKIDANRRVYKEAFERLQEEVRSPLNQWEQAEKERVQRHEQRIESIKQNTELGDDACSVSISSAIDMLNELVIDESWEEFETEAHRVKNDCLKQLQDQLEKRKKYESEQAELEQLRKAAAEQAQKDREAQVAREAAEQARKEAEQAVQAEREKAERERIAAEMAAEQAKRDLELAEQRRIAQEYQAKLDAIAAEKRAAEQAEAARQAEIDRQAAEAKRIEDERLKREADTKHKGAINRKALADLVEHANITEEQAKAVVKAIVSGKVSNVSISY